MTNFLEQATGILPLTETEDSCFQLSYSERLIGFGITGICGIFAGILSIVSLFILNLRKFAVLFTLSTISFFASLALLVGIKNVLKSCTNRKRMIASGVLVGSMILTLLFGVVKRWIVMSIISFVMEILSFLYFALSYIPGGDKLFHLIVF